MKRETKILKADHNPIEVGDNVLVDVKTKTKKRKNPTGPGPDVVMPTRLPRKSLDERITEALTKALKPVVSRLDGIESDIKVINTRLDKQDEFNQVVTNYIEDQKSLNKKFSDYIESHP